MASTAGKPSLTGRQPPLEPEIPSPEPPEEPPFAPSPAPAPAPWHDPGPPVRTIDLPPDSPTRGVPLEEPPKHPIRP